MSELKLAIDIDRLASELNELAAISDCPEPPPAVTRVVFTETDERSRDYLSVLFAKAGLKVRVDPIGNTFARWEGSRPELASVGTGSHTDAIPFAGMYDGTVGVLGGLEAIRSLQRSGFQPTRSIELVLFTSEEPTRFGIGCTGSRAMAGTLSPAQLATLRGADDKTFDEARLQAGFHGSLDDIRLSKNYFHAWVELHIEQGPELEAKQIDIGIVSAIAAPATLFFSIIGEGGHAGAVLMPTRKDALCAASEIIIAIEKIARESKSPDLVATVGTLTVHPSAVNSIPSHVRFSLDIRDIDEQNRDERVRKILEQAAAICKHRDVELQSETKNSDPPAISDATIVQAIRQACEASQFNHQTMISRAYHDSLFVSQFAPISMIFVPCRKGVSHRPDEFSSPQQIARGTEVLARTLASLSLHSV